MASNCPRAISGAAVTKATIASTLLVTVNTIRPARNDPMLARKRREDQREDEDDLGHLQSGLRGRARVGRPSQIDMALITTQAANAGSIGLRASHGPDSLPRRH